MWSTHLEKFLNFSFEQKANATRSGYLRQSEVNNVDELRQLLVKHRSYLGQLFTGGSWDHQY